VSMLMSGVFELAFTQGGLHFSAAANPGVDVRPFDALFGKSDHVMRIVLDCRSVS
jgi:hypothetical protein